MNALLIENKEYFLDVFKKHSDANSIHSQTLSVAGRNVPTAAVKKYLGHKSLATTLKYAHVEDESLREALHLLRG